MIDKCLELMIFAISSVLGSISISIRISIGWLLLQKRASYNIYSSR